MKKTLKKLIAVLLASAISVSMFACDIVTLNNERVSEQVVATVQVYDGAPVEKITNSQIMSAYSSYGYYYVQNFGYTVEETVELILNSLIQNKVYVQNAMNYFNNLDGFVKNTEFDATFGNDDWNPSKYLTAEEILDAKYEVRKSVNTAIENYMPAKETESKEEYTATARTAPTGATNYTEQEPDKANYVIVTGSYDTGKVSDSERREAYYKLLKAMDGSGHIDSKFDWKKGNIEDTEYFKESLKQQYETALVSKYEKYLAYDYSLTVDFDSVSSAYADMYNAQVLNYVSESAYETALGSATAASPVVYNPYEGYAYVYNLLLGADTTLSAKITEIKTEYTNNEITKEEYFTKREAVLNDITASDLRNTWITAGYDFDYSTKTFLNDYALATTPLTYKGEVTWTNKGEYAAEKVTETKGSFFKYYTMDGTEKVYDDDYAPSYKAVSTVYTLDTFLPMMDEYVYGSSMTGTTDTVDGISLKKVVNSNVDVAEWDEKINELIFAFSTDTGSLNTYKGYTIGNKTMYGTETYVEEYAAAARALKDMGKSSYVVVGTEYGWHIMFLSERIAAGTNYDTLVKYLNALGTTKTDAEWVAYYNQMLKDIRDGEVDGYEDFYLYSLQQAVTSTAASSYVTTVKTNAYNAVKNNDSKIKTYQDRLNNIYGE